MERVLGCRFKFLQRCREMPLTTLQHGESTSPLNMCDSRISHRLLGFVKVTLTLVTKQAF